MSYLYRKYPEHILKKLQQAEQDILDDFDRICAKHNLSYFAIGGTLIGALRHKGFIPWDDDVDLGMMREDWDAFLKVYPEEMPGYTLLSPDTGASYYSFVPKLMKNGTVFQPELAARSGRFPGIHIEIFVFENVDPDKKTFYKQTKKLRKTSFWMFMSEIKKPYSTNRFPISAAKNLVKKLLYYWAHITGKTAEKLDKQFLDAAITNAETGYVTVFSDDISEILLQQKKDFFPIQKVPFENGMIPISANARTLLEKEYGKHWEELPPVENRWNHAPHYIRFEDGEEYWFEDEEIGSAEKVVKESPADTNIS